MIAAFIVAAVVVCALAEWLLRRGHSTHAEPVVDVSLPNVDAPAVETEAAPEARTVEEQWSELITAANERAGGKYIAINVGPSRHERRAAKAIERKTKGRASAAR